MSCCPSIPIGMFPFSFLWVSAPIKLQGELRSDLSTYTIQTKLLYPDVQVMSTWRAAHRAQLLQVALRGVRRRIEAIVIARLAIFFPLNLFSQAWLQTSPDIWLLYMINSRLCSCEHE